MKLPIPKLLSVAIAALTLHTASTALADDIIGEARSQKSGELLYTETYAKLDETHWRVEYTAPDGSTIASKDVDYSPSNIAPALQLHDFRNDSELRIEYDGDQLSVQTDGARERRITLEDQLVVDAGFDNFVRVSWDELTSGKSVSFPFLVAGRNSPITMSAQVTEASRCEAQSGDAVLCIEVAVRSRLISFFADPIMLSYDYASQRLLRYHGLSNLKAADGSNQFVEISYRYPDGDDAIAALPNPRAASSQ